MSGRAAVHLLAAVVLAAAALLPPCMQKALAKEPASRALAVSRFPEGTELMRVGIDGEKGFSLTFIHSVSLTEVVDCYDIRGGRIVQTAEYFSAHGAGLPSQADEPGGIAWEKQGDRFVLRMERPIPKLVVRTDRRYENRLHIGGKTVNLNQWEDQALLVSLVP